MEEAPENGKELSHSAHANESSMARNCHILHMPMKLMNLSVINQQHILQSSTLILLQHVQRTLSLNKGYQLHCPNVTCYFFPLTSIYIPQHPAIKHTQSHFFFCYASTAIQMGKWKYSFLDQSLTTQHFGRIYFLYLRDSFLL